MGDGGTGGSGAATFSVVASTTGRVSTVISTVTTIKTEALVLKGSLTLLGKWKASYSLMKFCYARQCFAFVILTTNQTVCIN